MSLPSGRVIFTERCYDVDDCHFIRVMNADGSEPVDAPWQPPCAHGATGEPHGLQRETPVFELAPLGDVAVAAFSDLPGRDHPAPGGPAEVRAVVLTSSGRRGSEMVDAAPAEARPGTLVRVAAEGDLVVVAWTDSAPGREGIWIRRFRFQRF